MQNYRWVSEKKFETCERTSLLNLDNLFENSEHITNNLIIGFDFLKLAAFCVRVCFIAFYHLYMCCILLT